MAVPYDRSRDQILAYTLQIVVSNFVYNTAELYKIMFQPSLYTIPNFVKLKFVIGRVYRTCTLCTLYRDGHGELIASI